ncbi:MAG: twin-arginine translocase subunit TatC, partial [Mycobacterium sp.]
LALIAGMVVGFIFFNPVWHFIERPLCDVKIRGYEGCTKLGVNQLVLNGPLDAFYLRVKVALIVGIILSSPVWLYQVWSFIAPGLYPKERRYVVPFVVGTSGLFVAGGAFAYRYAFPIALNFLISYAHRFTPQININEYFDLFATVVLGLGLIFELPTLIFFLSLLGVVNARWLMKNFRYAVLVIFVLAAVITPTADITTMMVFATPMLVLSVLGIGIAYIFGKDRRDRKRRSAAD